MISAEWIDVHDTRWQRALERTQHDVYHLQDYVRLDTLLSGGEPLAFLARRGVNTFLLPMMVKQIPSPLAEDYGWRDASSPYGFPGPCVSFAQDDRPAERAKFLDDSIEAMLESMRKAGIVSGFIHLHPLWQPGLTQLAKKGHVVDHGQTVYCDLALSDEELWRQTRKRDRSYINCSRRAGFRVQRDLEWNRIDDFVDIYHASMRRVAAADFYFFPRAYFHRLGCELRSHASLFLVLDPNDRVAGGGIFTECGGTVQYHLGATSDDFLGQHPSKLMLHHVRRWAKARGNQYLHLGGGVNSQHDSLFHFKSGFSKQRAVYSSCRFVADQHAYAALLGQSERENSLTASSCGGFFPGYRKPARLPISAGRHPMQYVSLAPEAPAAA